MSKSRISITWDEDNEKRLVEIIMEFGDKMRLHDISPYTNTTPTGQRKPNTSGIIQFALMVLAGEIDLSD